MRKQSDKKKRERAEAKKFDDAAKDRLEHKCEWCKQPSHLTVHHTCGGSHRRELANFRTTPYLCWSCHSEHWEGKPKREQLEMLNEINKQAMLGELGWRDFPDD